MRSRPEIGESPIKRDREGMRSEIFSARAISQTLRRCQLIIYRRTGRKSGRVPARGRSEGARSRFDCVGIPDEPRLTLQRTRPFR